MEDDRHCSMCFYFWCKSSESGMYCRFLKRKITVRKDARRCKHYVAYTKRNLENSF